MKTVTLIAPDDWHCHFREGDFLARTVADSARRFCRAMAMPNLIDPVTTVARAKDYCHQIKAAVPSGRSLTPLMTLYLTETMTADTIRQAAASDFIQGIKLYPAGATTHSAAGIASLEKIYPLLAVMEEEQIVLQIHGEVTDRETDIFDREALFIERELVPIVEHFPKLKIVLEHITTSHAVSFIESASACLAATITPHHLWLNRNDLLAGGIRPHYYCLPVVKRRSHQQALLKAATSGHPRFFLGTDSAPHVIDEKESACGCAGIYSAHAALEYYAQLFDQRGALDKLENFSSVFGAQFYAMPVNVERIMLIEKPWRIPNTLSFGKHQLVPLGAGETLSWTIKSE